MRRLIISLINRVKAVKLYFTMMRFSSSWLSSTATILWPLARNSNFFSVSLAKTWLAIKFAVPTLSDIRIIHVVSLILGGGFITSILLNNIIFMKLFFVLGSISSFIMSFYYILNIFLFIKFSNKKPVTAEVQDRLNYLPQFIKDWVKFIEKMSKYEDKEYYIEFYLRLIVLYLLIFLMCVTILIKLVSV
jgi:hypothetical protein